MLHYWKRGSEKPSAWVQKSRVIASQVVNPFIYLFIYIPRGSWTASYNWEASRGVHWMCGGQGSRTGVDGLYDPVYERKSSMGRWRRARKGAWGQIPWDFGRGGNAKVTKSVSVGTYKRGIQRSSSFHYNVSWGICRYQTLTGNRVEMKMVLCHLVVEKATFLSGVCVFLQYLKFIPSKYLANNLII